MLEGPQEGVLCFLDSGVWSRLIMLKMPAATQAARRYAGNQPMRKSISQEQVLKECWQSIPARWDELVIPRRRALEALTNGNTLRRKWFPPQALIQAPVAKDWVVSWPLGLAGS